MTNTGRQLRGMGIRRRSVNRTLALAILLLSTVITTRSAQAQSFTVLYAFTGTPDGNSPVGSLVRDAAGNLYGTTYVGGEYDGGTVFKVDAIGNETVLYSFGGKGGKYPTAGLVRDAAGNLYGTAFGGGAFHLGTVFKLNTAGKCLKVLHTFAGPDGQWPSSSLIRDAGGNLYGTAVHGGASDYGTVFKLDATGKATVLYSFTGGADGAYPSAGLIRDAAGNLYSTTVSGGDDYYHGTVFKLDAAGKETVLYSFTGAADGAFPSAGLIRDGAKNLYGTTVSGGDLTCNAPSGCGTVFKIDSHGIETVLYRFTGGADGAYPSAGLIRDAAGNLYSTTVNGGDLTCNAPSGCGTVFKIDSNGIETVLYRFSGGADGYWPQAGLIRDAAGNLYGTASAGGPSGSGTVFKLAP